MILKAVERLMTNWRELGRVEPLFEIPDENPCAIQEIPSENGPMNGRSRTEPEIRQHLP